jgi:2-keto-4-pentenoate hydratase/2-oxohepta-3-ene-1,7-dioic acid hydratase in catechol pathway
MRWVTYQSGALSRVGLVAEGKVHGGPGGLTLLQLIEQGPDAMRAVGARILERPDELLDRDEVQLLLPFRPPTIRDAAGFLQHLRNNARVLGNELDPRFGQYPPFYFGNAAAAVGPGAPIRTPAGTQQLDFELEIGAVIGKPGSDISVASARDHIAGYLIFCDWSARDLHMAERGLFAPMKGKDFANSLGPALVTPDELADRSSAKGYDLGMTAYVNGEPVSEGNWSQVDWDFPDMIAFASRNVELIPGEVIGSGTVPSGCLLEAYSLDPGTFRGWLQPGDEVVMRVERLGELRHSIVPSSPVQRLSSGY